MVKLILADGTELKGFKQNGNNYVSKTEVDVSVFEDNLSTLTIVDGDTQMVMHNAELIQQVQYADGWYLCFREKTEQEMRYAELMGKFEYLAMMTGVDMEVEIMEHSKNYEKVKKFYKMGIWSEKMVWNAVGKWITPEEYKEITGEDYSKEG